MVNKHTPGPWTARDEKTGKYNSNHDWRVSDEADDVRTSGAAAIWGGNEVIAFAVGSSNSYLSKLPDIDANARLIAAAPDLLEALKGAASVLGLNGCFEAQDRARVAIAKATGEQT